MWLIVLMCALLMLPMAFAAVVYLCAAAWRLFDALLQGTIGALRLTWRASVGLWRATRWALRTGHLMALRLKEWHHLGSTWAGQYLQASWLAWSGVLQRRYVAGQLRRMRRAQHARE